MFSCEFCKTFKNAFFREHITPLESKSPILCQLLSLCGDRSFQLCCKSMNIRLIIQLFCKMAVLKNFAELTGKQLCLSLFWIKLQAKRVQLSQRSDSGTGGFLWTFWNLRTPDLQNTCGWLLLYMERKGKEGKEEYFIIRAVSPVFYSATKLIEITASWK